MVSFTSAKFLVESDMLDVCFMYLRIMSKQLMPYFLQCFYFLGEHNDSLSYALGAGSLFDVSEDSDYVHTLLGKL
jgi:hypothetical protein